MTLKTTYLLLSEVVEADRNVRDHSDGDPHLVGSIGRLGFLDPIFRDDRTGKLIDGHGRLYRLRDMETAGDEPPEQVQVTPKGWKVPVLTGWSSRDDAEAEAASIALQPKDGRYDERALYDILHRQDDLTGLGFGADHVSDLGRRLGVLARENTAFLGEFTDHIPGVTPDLNAAPVAPPLPSPTPGQPTPPPADPDDPGPSDEHAPGPDLGQPAPAAPEAITNQDAGALSGTIKAVDDRVVLQIPMTNDQRRQVTGLLAHAKARAGLDTAADALVWALERSPAAPSVDEDGARRAADTVRSALQAMRDGDLDRATTIMNSLVGVPA